MNLSDIKAVNSVVHEFTHPLTGEVITHDKKPFTATLTQLDTPAVKIVQNTYKGVGEAKTVQQENKRVYELFAAATQSIVYYDDGKWHTVSDSKDIVALFANSSTDWMYEQIVEKIGKSGNFLTVSDASTTQKPSDISTESKTKS